jgi:hypothetical protein
MVLHEFDPATQRYTGRGCEVQVTSITSFAEPCAVSNEAMNPDFCILSVRAKSRIQHTGVRGALRMPRSAPGLTI